MKEVRPYFGEIKREKVSKKSLEKPLEEKTIKEEIKKILETES